MAPARAAIARVMIPMPIRLDPAFLRQRFVLIGQADRGQRDEAAGLVVQAQLVCPGRSFPSWSPHKEVFKGNATLACGKQSVTL
jgi:hypothetical protein